MKNTLTVTTPSDLEIVMTRAFDAPRRLVWEAMTKPEFIKRWLFLPSGWAMTTCQEDQRIGGSFHWAWNGPDDKPAMSMRGIYREVSPPERFVRTEVFEMDSCGQQPGGPLEQVASIVLTEQAGGRKTLLTLTVTYKTKQARDGMIASGMERGVSAGYDKLEAMLSPGGMEFSNQAP